MDCAAGFGAADCRLDGEQLLGLRCAGNFRLHELHDLGHLIAETHLTGGVHMLENYVVVDGEVSRRLVGDMDLVTLVDQAYEGAAH